MAFIIMCNGKEKGPYPNKEGEYCGNHHPDSELNHEYGATPEQALVHQTAWLSKMRFGKPRPCKAGTTEELKQEGYVGLYLRATRLLREHEIEVPTPEELKEPK